MYEEVSGNKTDKCGMFVSETVPYLGASPCRIGDMFSIHRRKKFADVLKEMGLKCFDGKDGTMGLKKNHAY